MSQGLRKVTSVTRPKEKNTFVTRPKERTYITSPNVKNHL